MGREDIVYEELQDIPSFDLKAELLFEVMLRRKIQERNITVWPQGNFSGNSVKM